MNKQETLEDANWKVIGTKNDTFYNGAKWQEERMYSEEDMKKSYEHGTFAIIEMGHGDTFEELLEQFKKK